jgi:hypothetical protein
MGRGAGAIAYPARPRRTIQRNRMATETGTIIATAATA